MFIYKIDFDPASETSLGKIARWIKPSSRILELGPATGYFSKYLHETLNCTLDGIEHSESMAEMAAPFFQKLLVDDLDQTQLLSQFTPQWYDYVIAADVLEHLRDPWKVCSQVSGLLRDGGKFLVSLPNIAHSAIIAELMDGRFEYRDEGLLDRTHLRFFTRKSALALLNSAGFKVLQLERTLLSAERTEFKQFPEKFPSDVHSYLLKSPDATTYQFVFQATPGHMSELDLQVWMGPTSPARPEFRTEVFWAAKGEDFRHGQGAAAFGVIGESKQTLQFPLSMNVRLGRIRLSPADRPGFFHLYGVRLIREKNGSYVVLWQSCGRDIGINSTMARIVFASEERSDIFNAIRRDGWIFIELPNDIEIVDHTFRIEIDIDWPVSPDFILLNSRVAEKFHQFEEELNETRHTLRTSNEEKMELTRAVGALNAENTSLKQLIATRAVQTALKVKAFVHRHQALKGLASGIAHLVERIIGQCSRTRSLIDRKVSHDQRI